MDAVVLAAGKGERLCGITAPFHKPLIVVNGQALIVAAVDAALPYVDQGRVIVVAAPENAWPISEVLGKRDVEIIIQRQPTGPADALMTGLQLCTQRRTLVLLGDNTLGVHDVPNIMEHDYAVGIQLHSANEPGIDRFTRFNYVTNRWDEKTPITWEHRDLEGNVAIWVGPLVVHTFTAQDVFTQDDTIVMTDRGPERLIGPFISDLVKDDDRMERIPVEARDVGVPA